LGAKGIAESPIIPTAPAIRNAILDAIGKPLYQLPMTPERVLTATVVG
jgi:CO/xanthine dehydrogenase Mo-binding subunit